MRKNYWNSTIKISPPKKKKRIIYRNLIADDTYEGKFTKYGKPVRLPLPKLVEKADTIFSLWIRNREKYCVLCGKTYDLQNGHFFKRGKKPTRWSEENCHTLCKGCNKRDNQEHDHYVSWFIKRYGAEFYQELFERSEIDVTSMWVRQKALEVIAKYKI